MNTSGPAAERTLRMAAQAALAAPSILNTQPWRWQAEQATLLLWADRSRQLLVADPDGRLLTVSCGGALHHARLALAVAGCEVSVQRLPDPARPDLLATVELVGEHAVTGAEQIAYAAVSQRRTDRRAFTAVPVADEDAAALVDAAENEGAHLYLIRDNDIAQLASIAARASALQIGDSAYREELESWVTARPQGAGVPLTTAVAGSPRSVPVREFAPMGGAGADPGEHTGSAARYAVIFTDGDDLADWLRAGEALSAVLLTAMACGLGTAPISDVTETTVTRERVRRLLSGIGHPQTSLRIGYPPPGLRPPARAAARARDELDTGLRTRER